MGHRTTIERALEGKGTVATDPQVVGRNTLRFTDGAGFVITVHHTTEIVRRYPDGRIKLDGGGWKTATTRSRINDALEGTPYSVIVRDGEWWVRFGNYEIEFRDGMILPSSDGTGWTS